MPRHAIQLCFLIFILVRTKHIPHRICRASSRFRLCRHLPSPFSFLMPILFHSPLSCTLWKLKDVRLSPSSFSAQWKFVSKSNRSQFGFTRANSDKTVVRALLFNPFEDPILKEAVKEPVAFMGGIFAGILRLDLEEEPLKEWVTRTVEAAGISEDEIDTEGSTTEAAPQQIEIE